MVNDLVELVRLRGCLVKVVMEVFGRW
jgi:hypothetical protein